MRTSINGAEIDVAPARGSARRRDGRSWSTRPGRLMPMPSQTTARCARRMRGNGRGPSARTNASGVCGVGHDVCSTKRASTPARPTVVDLRPQLDGDDAGALDIEMEERRRRVRAAPWPTAPSVTQPSSISSSTMAETVLRCRPGHAREIRARHRSVEADEVERDTTIDLAGVLARRDLDDGQFALAHRAVPSEAKFLGASNDKSARVLLSISLCVLGFTVLERRSPGGARRRWRRAEPTDRPRRSGRWSWPRRRSSTEFRLMSGAGPVHRRRSAGAPSVTPPGARRPLRAQGG